MSAVHDLKTGERIDEFDAAYRRVRAQYDAANAQAGEFGGPCKTCRHFYKEGDGLSDDYCMNPLAVTLHFDKEAGEVVTDGHLIRTWMLSRNDPGVPGLCGENRRLWEERTHWQAYWGWYVALAILALPGAIMFAF